MIVTKRKDPEVILKMLSKVKRVFIVGCGDCAATCKTGGEEEIKAMASFLASRGKEIAGVALPDDTCVTAQVKAMFAKNRTAIKGSEAILVLACGSGIQCVKENDRQGLDVYPGCDSLFAAAVDAKGDFQEFCSACGDCLLDLTEGVCPLTRCSKGLLNGPCGGHNQEKCEADNEKDCAWVLIYKRLKAKGMLSRLKERLPAKDHRKVKKRSLLSSPEPGRKN